MYRLCVNIWQKCFLKCQEIIYKVNCLYIQNQSHTFAEISSGIIWKYSQCHINLECTNFLVAAPYHCNQICLDFFLLIFLLLSLFIWSLILCLSLSVSFTALLLNELGKHFISCISFPFFQVIFHFCQVLQQLSDLFFISADLLARLLFRAIGLIIL